jgi:KDO2-lipid IV(A) lauroyltransferase
LAQKKSWLTTHAEYVVAASLVAVLRRLPPAPAGKVAQAATGLLDRSVPKLRRVARKNLSFAYPQLSESDREQLITGVFRNVARMILAIAWFPDLNASNIGEWIGYEGLEHYQNAKRCGRGILIATAHLGNWELSAFAHALMTESMNVMVRPLDNLMIDRLVERRRTLSGNRLIYKQDGARAVLRALRNNEAVGILIDQNTAETEGIFVDFFGKAACANSGFVKLAYHSRAPVVPGFAVWEEPGRYVLHFRPPIEMTGDEARDTQHIHSEMENIIRLYPDQWMWIHRRWNTRPPGESPLY